MEFFFAFLSDSFASLCVIVDILKSCKSYNPENPDSDIPHSKPTLYFVSFVKPFVPFVFKSLTLSKPHTRQNPMPNT